MSDRLFTPRFFVMCAFTFIVFFYVTRCRFSSLTAPS